MKMTKENEIRFRVKANCLSYIWLIDILGKRGIRTTSPELSGILSGSRKGPIPERILDESLDILDRYEAMVDDLV